MARAERMGAPPLLAVTKDFPRDASRSAPEERGARTAGGVAGSGSPASQRLPWLFLAAQSLVVIVYFAEPGWHLGTWSVIGFGSAAAVVAGTRRNQPAGRRPWYLLAGAIVTLVCGDTVYNLLTDVVGEVQPFPSAADACYLLTYPLAAAGLMLMIRRRSPSRDLPALVDALVLTVSLALLIWVFTITPTVSDRTVPWTSSAVSIAYPLGDVLLLAVTLRLLTGGNGGAGYGLSVRLLILGVLGLAGSDIAYALVRLYGTWHVGSPADLGWIVFYLSWGAAALHPSMTWLTEPHRQARGVTTGRVIPLALAALVAPTVLLVESFQGHLRDGTIIAVASAVMFLLVLFRLAIQGREIRHQESLAHTRAMVRELRHRAYRDPLTGLGNRLKFQERAEKALQRAEESGGAACMLLIDLDNFKEVNDTQGHRAGDELLIAAAGRLAAAVRSGDLPVRLGGDEFAVLLADGSPPESAEALAARLIRTFSTPFGVSGVSVEVRASIGVATSADAPSDPGEDAGEVLFRNADLALYAAKADGKAIWRRYEPQLYEAATDRLNLRNNLDNAIVAEEFAVHYQPVVDLRGPLRVSGFEALARWHHPERGLIMPDQFIPLAEETGQIVPLGAWILERAIADAARWNRHEARPRSVAVNVSAQQFLGHGLVDAIAGRLEETGLPPELLVLEITETAFLHHHGADVSRNLNALAALGVRIAIDDFGTGYSSLSYLRDMQIDILKADKSFVDRIADDHEHEVLLAGIVHVSHSLGIDVVAEGVETPEQVALLRKMGCAYAQGYLFSAAVPVTEVPGLLASIDAPTVGAPATRGDAL